MCINPLHRSSSGDAQKLFREHAVQMRGCVELSFLARTANPGAWPPPPPPPPQPPTAANTAPSSVNKAPKAPAAPKMALIALARLVAHYTGEALPKGRVQRSNWEAQLSALQQTCELLASSIIRFLSFVSFYIYIYL